MTDQIRRAGRRGVRTESHEPRLAAHLFVDPAMLVTEPEWDGTHKIVDWGMDANDSLGDCGAAAVDHYNMAKASDATLLDSLGKPTFDGTVATYYAYGVDQGEGPNADQGVDNATFLGFLYKHKIIAGYAEVDKDMAFAMAQKFGGVLIGQSLPDSAETDFEATPPIPWGSAGEVPDQREGHDTLLIKTHADGSGEFVTWGALQPFTSTYFRDFVSECWIIFDRDDPQVDWPALEAALLAVHGVVTDLTPPVVPTPTPTPVPAPVPAPSPEPVDLIHTIIAALEQIGHDLRALLELLRRDL
jgi:hypothetical protein